MIGDSGQPSGQRVTIHQPNLFPRHKVLQKIAAADVWVVLDNVQYVKREWQNRCRLAPDHGLGEPFWLTLPVHLCDGRATRISDVRLVDCDATFDCVRDTLQNSFRHSAGWASAGHELLALFDRPHDSLTRVCVDTTVALIEAAGLPVPRIVFASDLGVTVDDPSQRLAALTRSVGGQQYLCDSGGANYLCLDHFDAYQIPVRWQLWNEPEGGFCGLAAVRDISALNLLVRDPLRYRRLTEESTWVTDPADLVAGSRLDDRLATASR